MTKVIIILLTVLLSASSWALPLKIIPGELGSSEIRVRVSVDGIDRDFQLDTGAKSTMVIPDQQTMTYPKVGTSTNTGASGIKIECDVIQPSEVHLDHRTIQDPHLDRCDLGEHSQNNLGLNILMGNILDFNFETESFQVLEKMPQNRKSDQLDRLDQGHLRMPVQLTDITIGGIFDTGAQLTSIDRKYVEQHRHLFHFIQKVDGGRDITGSPVEMELYKISHLKIGGVTFENVSVLAFDFQNLRNYLGKDTPLILGNNLILQANWILDLKEYRWAIYQ